jgi:hypothetical protein
LQETNFFDLSACEAPDNVSKQLKTLKLNGQKHIINRQVLELTIPERGVARSIQNKTSEIVKYKLQPALDKLFSKLTTADEIVRIDKLVIDLGTVSMDELEKVLVERSLNEISDKISRLKISGLTDKGIKPVNGNSVDENRKFTTLSKSKDVLDQFVYFLQFGRFPWWHKSDKSSAKPVTDQLEEIFAEILKFEATVLKSSIFPLLGDPSVRKRLVFQFNHSQLNALLKKLDKKLFETFFSVFRVLLSSVKSTEKRIDLTNCFYKIVLHNFTAEQNFKVSNFKVSDLKIEFINEVLGIFLTKYSIKENETLLIEILQTLENQQSISSPENWDLTVATVVQVALKLHSHNQVLHEIIQNILLKSGPKVKSLVEQQLKITIKEYVKNNGADETVSGKNVKDLLVENIKGAIIENRKKPFSPFPPKPADDAEGIVVSNAGLVLIHPFLRYFFDGLGLLDKELHFKSQSDVFKAIHLLQFIATEQNLSPENDLPLNKILCGIEINEPVPKSLHLSKMEKEECLGLIITVLERWDALKTRNPEALRDTYLQREGILKQSGQSWNLTIERNSFDVMLEKLPWSINLIKLPWLSQILYVEW